MINSAIFEAYSKYMYHTIKYFLLIILILTSFTGVAQYTETINSNRPGASQGAYSVGNAIIQAEAGVDFGNDTHPILNTDVDIYGGNLALRYGFLIETLEFNANFRYQANKYSFTRGSASPEYINGLEFAQVGAKYLIYDPYKYGPDPVNLYSYHANHGIKWKHLIPAVSAYASAIFDFTNNPFVPVIEDGISPNIALITQNNWGRWVWVNNIIADRISTEFPSYAWITTMTHAFTPKISGFLEFQMLDGDLYSDYIARLGGAFLLTNDLQIDVNGLINFKNTPSRWNIGVGISYRLDFHFVDQELDIEESASGSAQKQSDRINKKKKNKRKDAVDPDGEGGGDN